MAVETHIYDDKFFKNTLALEGETARAVTKIFVKYFSPASVIDIGCGIGVYLREFEKYGIEVLGCDGSPAAIKNSLVGEKITLHDLCLPFKIDRLFDLCICIEVAEHLEEKYADTLVDTLVRLSDKVVFTAATPGQGPRSIGHINEQLPDYWLRKFEQRKYIFKKDLSINIKQEMKEKEVVWWVEKNLMVFYKII